MSADAAPMRLLGAADVDALATVELGLAAAEAAARLDRSKIAMGRVQVNGDVSWSRILAGSLTELDVTGYKEFHRVDKRVRYHIHLFQESTGDAIGIADGRRITSLRTSSTAAVAVRTWAAGRSVRVGVIGSGEEAREGLRAINGAVNISQAAVYSPTPENRRAYAQKMSTELGIPIQDCDSQDKVLEDCDVLYVATSSKGEPFLGLAEIGHIPMVAAIGATQPADRELRADVFPEATVVVDVLDAVTESGDGIAAISEGWDPQSSLLLGEYLERAGENRSQRTLFKSIGSVEQDLVLALHLLNTAADQGRGVVVDPVGSLRVMR